MANDQQHIIQKLNVEVNVPDVTTARHIHDNVLSFLHSHVFPQLEAMLKEMGIEEKIYRTEQLSLALDFDNEEQFNNTLAATMLQAMREKIVTVVAKDKAVIKDAALQPGGAQDQREEAQLPAVTTVPAKRWEVFLYFLRTGMLPWFAEKNEEWLAEEKLDLLIGTAGLDWKPSFFELVSKQEVARRRLAYQFNTRFIITLISKYTGQELAPVMTLLQKEVQALPPEVQRKARQQVILHILHAATVIQQPGIAVMETAQQVIHESIQQAKEEKAAPAPLYSEEEKIFNTAGEEQEDSIYVSNTGLILLHPFLQYYFKDFGLLEGDRFKDEAAKQTAVHLLYYLATGREQPPEYELVMEKYLCGVYIYEPIERFEALTDKMKEESDHLLSAVIHHWKVLKNTSPDGLREAFLQRNGKLVINGGREKVIIEHAAIDILLDQLPWNYSIITLPWIDKILYADWMTN